MGVSRATRGSIHSAIAIAVPLVFDRANLHPVLPVQAMRPARMLEALAVSPISCRQRSISSAFSALTPDSSRFCHTVSRISPSPRSRAISASARICATVMRPTGSATPTQTSPGCFCGWMPTWACRCCRFGCEMCCCGTRVRGRPSFASTSPRNLSKPQASSTYLRRAFLRSVRSPLSMNTRTTASATATASSGFTSTPVGRAKSWWPVMPPSPSLNHTPDSTGAPSPTATAVKAMSLVSSSTGMAPPPSKPTLNLRGRP